MDLAFIYPQWRIAADNLVWWLPLSAAVLFTAILWRYRNGWSREILFAWGFFCVALLPVMGFTDVGFMRHSLVADRYQHIAIIAVICLASAGWSTGAAHQSFAAMAGDGDCRRRDRNLSRSILAPKRHLQ